MKKLIPVVLIALLLSGCATVITTKDLPKLKQQCQEAGGTFTAHTYNNSPIDQLTWTTSCFVGGQSVG